MHKREDMQATLAADDQTVQWHVARRRKCVEQPDEEWQKSLAQANEKLKAQGRAYWRCASSCAGLPRADLMPLDIVVSHCCVWRGGILIPPWKANDHPSQTRSQ